MSRQRRAYVVGYYGMSNFGDDLFCEVMTSRAPELLSGYNVKIVGNSGRLGRRIYSAPTAIGSIWRLIVGIFAVLRADLIVLGGGSVLWRLDGVRLVQWKLSHFARTAFQSLGVSIGPFAVSTDERGVAEFLDGNDRVIVRDNESLAVAIEMGLGEKVQMGGDLAALYPRTVNQRAELDAHHRTVGVALCNFPEYTEFETEILESFVSAIRASSRPGRQDRISVISLNSHPVYGDDSLSLRAVEHLTASGLAATFHRYSDLGISKTWDLITSLDAMAAVRLHAAIPAYLSGVPFALLEYHPKCKNFCDEIGQDDSLRWTLKSENRNYVDVLEGLLGQPKRTMLSPADYTSRAEKAYRADSGMW